MMKSNVSQYDFEQAFRDYGRNDQFTYNALRALYDYLIEMEESCDEEFELDVIGLCCEYSEHATALEAAKEYGFEPEQDPAALMYFSENLLELVMTLEEAESCSHQGKCDEDVEELLKQPHIAAQFILMDIDDIRADLKELGAWTDEELEDDEENAVRFLWIAAGSISEEYNEEEQETAAVEWLNERTQVIVFTGGVIIQGF